MSTEVARPLLQRLADREVRITGKDGRTYLVRSIEPADVPSLQRGYEAMPERARRFRTLHALPELSDEMALEYCSPDNVDEFCLVVEGQDELAGDIVGGARISGDPNRRSAEFSVSFRPEGQGLGLARATLALALELAAGRGYRRIWGLIAARNSAMLRLARRLGFQIMGDPDDARQYIAELMLEPGR